MANPGPPPLPLKAPPSLTDTLGSMFLGLIASTLIFGITCVQLHMYFERFQKDNLKLKILVVAIFLLDAVILSLQIHYMYHYTISSFGDYIALQKPTLTLKVQDLLLCILIPLIQSMYCLRVWKVARGDKVIPCIVTLTIGCGWVIGLLTGIKFLFPETFSGISTQKWLLYLSNAAASLVDLTICGAMIYYLQSARSEFRPTNSIITRLIVLVSSTALLTSAFALAVLIAYAAAPDNLIWFSIDSVLSKLYVTSFMVVLNARHALRERRGIDPIHLTPLSNSSMSHTKRRDPTPAVETVISRDKTYGNDSVGDLRDGDECKDFGV